jgi:hypothetical protein
MAHIDKETQSNRKWTTEPCNEKKFSLARDGYKCGHFRCPAAEVASNTKMRTAWLFLGLLAVTAARFFEVSP